MDVQLYVYDLSQGMARSMSRQFLGFQIDAVYHTSLVFEGVEYFFGAGVQTCYPGTTHHGRPMEIIPLGTTELPIDTILDYLESLKEVYTPESYDLFAHNCNNFTHDFATFLVGKGVPDHITSLPKRVLETPFGQMLRPQLERGIGSVTQAEIPMENRVPPMASGFGAAKATEAFPSHTTRASNGSHERYGLVVNLTSTNSLDAHMAGAADTCTTVFFTSSTCAPCKWAYPMFDNLASEHSDCLFVKVDINEARDIAMRYKIRATPTLMTFSKGAKLDEWSGADPTLLKANFERLHQETFPTHPHLQLKVPTLQFGSMSPMTYARTPPLDKLMTKLADSGYQKGLLSLKTFVETKSRSPQDAPLPDLHSIAQTFKTDVLDLPIEVRFAAVDLLRCAMADGRVSGFFAEENEPKTVPLLVQHINGLQSACPHNLRLVTIQLACNIFSSHLYVKELMQSDDTSISDIIQLITSSLLDASHPTVRVASGSLSFNLAVANYKVRREQGEEALAEGEQVELVASMLETLSEEQNEDAAKGLLLALGFLVYCAPENGELADLCKAMDAKRTVGKVKGHDSLVKEVESLLM